MVLLPILVQPLRDFSGWVDFGVRRQANRERRPFGITEDLAPYC